MASVGNNNNEENVFTAKRSLNIFSVSSKWKDLKTLVGKDDVTLKEIRKFIKGIDYSRDYSTVFFSNKFKVDQPIVLVGFGFYGPFDENQATYRVYIQVEDQTSNVQIASTVQTIEAKTGEIFTVQFPNSVTISPGVNYLVRFRLDGPSTCVGDPEKILTKCCVKGINFEFNVGSQQMPTILFKIASPPKCYST